MSITSNFPAIKPTLLLDFANTKQLDPRITFTRASTATYYGTQTAKAEENLLLQSQTFDNASWTKTRSTVTANDTAAPDGTTTADKIQQNAGATTAGLCQQSATSVSGSSYVISVFAKAGTNKNFLLVQDTLFSTSGSEVWFDVLNGTVGTIERPASHTASIVSVGNGWFRCIVQFTASVSNAGNVVFYAAQTDNTTTVTDDQGFIYLWGAQLEQRSAVTAYTVTTTQAITNYIPQLLTAASGVARFDNNPTTFESLGLLIEESRTNLVTYSDQFDNAAWTKTRSSITANTIVAPDGTLTGDKLVEDTTASNSHVILQSIVFPASGTVAATIYAKAAERNFVLLSRGTLNACGVNLTTGQVVGVSGTDTTATTQSVGNGWWRIILVFPSPNITTTINIYPSLDGVFANRDYTGNGYSGIYIWGAQLEAGAFATSYIPTVASQVTRAADSASMTGTNFSTWYNQAEGTFFSSVVLSQTPTQLNSQIIFVASDNTTSNRVIVSLGSGNSGNINALVTTGGVTQAQTINGGLSTAGAYQYANAYKVNDFASVANGGVAATDTSGTIPVVDRLYLGVNSSGTTTSLTATIKKIAYYPLRVTNAQLQGLTS